jgi:hypothetical protein
VIVNDLIAICNFRKVRKVSTTFVVRNIQQAAFGRREIEIAEQGNVTCLCFFALTIIMLRGLTL